jgi:hypothetical protein
MPQIVSVDPGFATGIAYGHYDDTTPYTLDNVITVPNEVIGVSELYFDDSWAFGNHQIPVVIENYIMDHGPQDPIALQVIGFIRGVTNAKEVIMRRRSDKAVVPDKVLKENGLWQTGKMVGWKDGRDANDAIIHGLGYVAFVLRHGPTLEKYYGVRQ